MLMGYFHHSKQFLHPDSTKWNCQWGKINDCPEGEGKTKQQIVTAVPGSLWTGHHRETGGSIKKGRKSWVNAEKVCPVSKEIHPYTQGSDERQRWPSAQTILLYHMAWYSKVLLCWPCIVSHLFKIQPNHTHLPQRRLGNEKWKPEDSRGGRQLGPSTFNSH